MSTSPAQRPATRTPSDRPRIALIAHDRKKDTMVALAQEFAPYLHTCILMATGTTGGRLVDEVGLTVERMLSGPLGGDLQIGAQIVEGSIDMLVFFWDPLEPQPHDPDVRALLRIAVVWNIPVACNRSTADFLVSSPLFSSEYDRQVAPHVAA